MLNITYDWYGFWARETQQIPPGNWRIWGILAGRGFGKTRTGAEWLRDRVQHGGSLRSALVARTKSDIRDVMVEGESGVLTIADPRFRPRYEPSKRRLTWPNGAVTTTFSADEPDQLRGPEHDTVWCDELAAWRRIEAWDMLSFGLRLGTDPRAMFTTTPRRSPLLRKILARPNVVITTGSTYDNADNLADAFIEEIITSYEGTRLGQQEIYAQMLEDNPDALWNYDSMIEAHRAPRPNNLLRIVVAVDPEASSSEEAAETGIIVVGLGIDRHGYVLADYTVRGTPSVWGAAVAQAYHDWDADMIVGEVNNGGEMVGYVIQTVDSRLPFSAVRATRGKLLRAEPVSSLYERGMVHHVGAFRELEDQMTQWTPGDKSPDRLDALVWGLTELMLMNQGRVMSIATSEGRFSDMSTRANLLAAGRKMQQGY